MKSVEIFYHQRMDRFRLLSYKTGFGGKASVREDSGFICEDSIRQKLGHLGRDAAAINQMIEKARKNPL